MKDFELCEMVQRTLQQGRIAPGDL